MKTKRFAVLLFVAVFAVLVVAGCTPQTERIPTAALPAGKAWAEGKEIFFVHTEASDSGVAEKLTSMMKSPVIFVPSLAKMPADALARGRSASSRTYSPIRRGPTVTARSVTSTR